MKTKTVSILIYTIPKLDPILSQTSHSTVLKKVGFEYEAEEVC